jgi:predicted membrane protein
MKPERFDRIASTRLLIGLWIVILGGILLLNNLGVIDAGQFWRYFWPLILVFIGTTMLINQTRTRRQRLGWVFVIVGGWIFINRLGWIDISIFKLLLPALLLFVGGTLVWRAFDAPRPHGPKPDAKPQLPEGLKRQVFRPDGSTTGEPAPVALQPEEPQAEFMRSFAVMSSNELRPVSRPFRGADLSAVMAGVKLNLLDARMESDSAEIEVFAFWGGMEIFVPPDWTVISRVTTLMGGFIDKRRPTTAVPTKTLIISGLVLMSGIEIKN